MTKSLDDYRLRLGKRDYIPIVIGGMGVDISTVELALEACRLGGIGHISDAMVQFVSDKRFKTHFTRSKSAQHASTRDSFDKSNVHFSLQDLYQAQLNLVNDTMSRKTGDGAVFINVMEKLTMASPTQTLRTRLHAALDGGIDGITLSAGLHKNSLSLMADNPRFREVHIGVVVSSLRALKIFLRSASRVDRLPDYVVVEGPLAGGHLGFGDDWQSYRLSDIVEDCVRFLQEESLNIAVVPAGGIFSGTDAVALLQAGAQAVQVATRFTVTEECGLPNKVKQLYFEATEADVLVSSVSPTGYPIRLLRSSRCLGSNIKPQCEPFGYALSSDGKCPYIDAYRDTPCDASGKKLPVRDKVCLCYHFSKHNCFTCGHYVYRLKDTTNRVAHGSYPLLSAEHVFNDYRYSTDYRVSLPAANVAQSGVEIR